MLWVGMGGHRSMLMGMVWVWVQMRGKCWALIDKRPSRMQRQFYVSKPGRAGSSFRSGSRILIFSLPFGRLPGGAAGWRA